MTTTVSIRPKSGAVLAISGLAIALLLAADSVEWTALAMAVLVGALLAASSRVSLDADCVTYRLPGWSKRIPVRSIDEVTLRRFFTGKDLPLTLDISGDGGE